MSPEVRYRVMSSIRKVDTKPELALRRALRGQGITGYRLHHGDVPGRPDVAFPRWRVAVFVDGVFWHGHPDYFQPGKLSAYWDKKIGGNVARDARVNGQLAEAGWLSVRIWDVAVLADPTYAANQVADALASRGWLSTVTRRRVAVGRSSSRDAR